jgi:hypothetical protein
MNMRLFQKQDAEQTAIFCRLGSHCVAGVPPVVACDVEALRNPTKMTQKANQLSITINTKLINNIRIKKSFNVDKYSKLRHWCWVTTHHELFI